MALVFPLPDDFDGPSFCYYQLQETRIYGVDVLQ